MQLPARFWKPLLTTCVCCITCSVIASAQTPPPGGAGSPNTSTRTTTAASHTIRGKVFLPSGAMPDQRIRVVLELSTGGIAGEVFTDSVGNFEFRSMPSNSYRVVVNADHQNFDTTMELVEVYGNFSRTFLVQVYLKDKDNGIRTTTKDRILSVAEMQEVPKPAKKSYEQGLKRARDNKPEEAIKQFEEAINAFPDYLLAINKLGEQYVALNRLEDAQAKFERAIGVNGKYALARINLGMLFVKQQRYTEAIEQLEAANSLDGSYPMCHLHLGIALMDKKPPEIDRAEKELQRAVESGGKDFSYVHLHLFNLNVRRNSLDKAAAQLEAYLKASPEAPNAPQVREKLGQLKKTLTQQVTPEKKP